MRTYNSVLHVALHEITLVSSVGCPSRGSPVPTRGTAGHRLRFQLFSKVMRVSNDTFGDLSFTRSYIISHPPRLLASLDSLHSFGCPSRSADKRVRSHTCGNPLIQKILQNQTCLTLQTCQKS